MSLNKNSIFAWASFILTLLGIALILLGVLKYPEYAIGFSVVGVGFIAIGSSDALDPARGYPHRIKELLRAEDKEANYTDEQ